jgi:hypothetical protein
MLKIVTWSPLWPTFSLALILYLAGCSSDDLVAFLVAHPIRSPHSTSAEVLCVPCNVFRRTWPTFFKLFESQRFWMQFARPVRSALQWLSPLAQLMLNETSLSISVWQKSLPEYSVAEHELITTLFGPEDLRTLNCMVYPNFFVRVSKSCEAPQKKE